MPEQDCVCKSSAVQAFELTKWFKGGGLDALWEDPLTAAAAVISDALLGSSPNVLQLHAPIEALQEKFRSERGSSSQC